MNNLSKKKKIIILSVMVALLLVTGFVNVAINSSLSSGEVATETSTANASFYATYRSEREATRTQEIQFYDSIIASASASSESKKEAESNKMLLINQMEKELVTEGIIKGKGFNDCVITTSSANVNVFVQTANLSKEEVAQITSIVISQLNVDIDKVIIIPSE